MPWFVHSNWNVVVRCAGRRSSSGLSRLYSALNIVFSSSESDASGLAWYSLATVQPRSAFSANFMIFCLVCKSAKLQKYCSLRRPSASFRSRHGVLHSCRYLCVAFVLGLRNVSSWKRSYHKVERFLLWSSVKSLTFPRTYQPLMQLSCPVWLAADIRSLTPPHLLAVGEFNKSIEHLIA